MNDKQRRRFERLSRSVSYGEANAADFPATSKGGQALARLKALLQDAETHDTARATNQRARQQATGSRTDGRTSLRVQISAIADTAEIIALDHAELKGAFTRPRTNVNDQTLLSVARSFAAAAEPLKALFLEYDMPPDFLDKFNASVESFEQAIGQQTSGTQARISANASLEDTLSRAEAELERFDTAARNKYRDDTARLAAWESARRLEQANKQKGAANRGGKKDGKDGKNNGGTGAA